MSKLVRHPAKDVGRASVGGVGMALVVYVLASAAVFGVIPAGELAQSTGPFADLAAGVFGASVAGLFAACVVIKALGTIAGGPSWAARRLGRRGRRGICRASSAAPADRGICHCPIP